MVDSSPGPTLSELESPGVGLRNPILTRGPVYEILPDCF